MDFHYLFQETAKLHEQTTPGFSMALQEAMRYLYQYHKRLQISENTYRIAFVGLGNVGKSTLLNALFGNIVAPSWNGPCTSFPIEFSLADENEFEIVIQRNASGLFREHITCDSFIELAEQIHDIMSNDSYNDQPKNIQVRFNSVLLQNKLIVVDTPGFGSVLTSENDNLHDENLLNYLREKTSQIFWVVTGANGGIGKREKDFYTTYLANYCDDLIITRTEDWDIDDKSRFVKRFRKELQNPFMNFFFVSATQGLQARNSGDDSLFEKSGVRNLHNRFLELSDCTKRSSQIEREVHELFKSVVAYVTDELTVKRHRDIDWHPTEWQRLRAKHGANSRSVDLLSKICVN